VGLVARRVALLSAIALAAVGTAHGAATVHPWAGGSARVTSFEADGTRIATLVARSDVSVECLGPARWRMLGAHHGFDPALTWAMTPMRWDGDIGGAAPEGISRLSPRTCGLADDFRRAPTETGSYLCRHGTAEGKPLVGECDDWGEKLLAVHVLSHESVHLAGVVDEATADCLGMQLDAYVAQRLGASRDFARSLARQYWAYYYPSQEPAYRSAGCRDGRALDLFPELDGWPTPTAYPPDVQRRVASFARRAPTVASLGDGS
jgi:hypothetical protein